MQVTLSCGGLSTIQGGCAIIRHHSLVSRWGTKVSLRQSPVPWLEGPFNKTSSDAVSVGESLEETLEAKFLKVESTKPPQPAP